MEITGQPLTHSEHLNTNIDTCPVCGSDDIATIAGGSGSWDLADCLECGAYRKNGVFAGLEYHHQWFTSTGNPINE